MKHTMIVAGAILLIAGVAARSWPGADTTAPLRRRRSRAAAEEGRCRKHPCRSRPRRRRARRGVRMARAKKPPSYGNLMVDGAESGECFRSGRQRSRSRFPDEEGRTSTRTPCGSAQKEQVPESELAGVLTFPRGPGASKHTHGASASPPATPDGAPGRSRAYRS